MPTDRDTKQNSTLAFLIAALSLLAAGFNLLSHHFQRHAPQAIRNEWLGFSLPSMFLCMGLLWLGIGVHWKRLAGKKQQDPL